MNKVKCIELLSNDYNVVLAFLLIEEPLIRNSWLENKVYIFIKLLNKTGSEDEDDDELEDGDTIYVND